jgi:hypothetical protein
MIASENLDTKTPPAYADCVSEKVCLVLRFQGWEGLSACTRDGRFKTVIFQRETLKFDVISE